MAKLYFRYGAMNSGKSTAVLQVAHNYEERGMKIWLIKPAADTKLADFIVSRLGSKRKVDLVASPEANLYKEFKKRLQSHREIDCILADEAQFFTAKQIDELMKIAVSENVPVICYGIRTDFRTRLFQGSRRLMEIAHTLEELKTICRCGKKAIFNGRKINGLFVFAGDQVAIDGKDKVEYESLCPRCYENYKKALA